jgi:hypothetical protein
VQFQRPIERLHTREQPLLQVDEDELTTSTAGLRQIRVTLEKPGELQLDAAALAESANAAVLGAASPGAVAVLEVDADHASQGERLADLT